MKIWFSAFLKALVAAYLVFTSLYCLLAFLPYTYYAFIKAPPEVWLPWFAGHHVQIYWLIFLLVAASSWPLCKSRTFVAGASGFFALGVFLAVRPFMVSLQSNGTAYAWSVSALAVLLVMGGVGVVRNWPEENDSVPALTYARPVTAALVIAVLGFLSTQLLAFTQTRTAGFHLREAEISFWSVATHVAVAIAGVSVFNLVAKAAGRTSFPRTLTTLAVMAALFFALFYSFGNFLGSVLNFQGWPAWLFAGLLAAALTLCVFSIALPLANRIAPVQGRTRRGQLLLCGLIGVLACAALALPSAVGTWDWNGVFQRAFTLVLWLGMSVGIYLLRPGKRAYSVPALLAVLVVTAFCYKGLQATEILWSRSLGDTDDDIARTLEAYAGRDVSFQFAHHALGNAPAAENCADLCHILRDYTNVRDAHTNTKVELVDGLSPAAGERPNIFILVIDSLRPDYLGAYNPQVDFTPNVDGLAWDSVVFRNAYTQYAGTTLSEPALWSGALLLHAHYLRPFENVNSLEKLARADSYQMFVSYDTILRELLSPADDLVKLDARTLWNEYDLCSTSDQLAGALDGRASRARPVFFYSQPMNVHQFARIRHLDEHPVNWQRPGMNGRIIKSVHQMDECMGRFVSVLKARGLYDNSIIILTSDHGDATGELGRVGHAEYIYPEIMHVPLIIHLPKAIQSKVVYDAERMATLTDVAPSLYYLLGHRAMRDNPLFGRPLFAASQKELERFRHHELFMASDCRAVYGILDGDGRYFYATYDSPAQSYLFDLAADPRGAHDVLNAEEKRKYDQRIIDYLKMISDFYGYQPGVTSLLATR